MNFTGGFFFLFDTISDLYLYLVIARFVLQTVRADFYNPMSQFIVKATSPLLVPMRRVVPGIGGIDLACVVLFLILIFIKMILAGLLFGFSGLIGPQLLLYMLIGVKNPLTQQVMISGALGLTLNFFMFVILIAVVSSWLTMGGGGYNPIMHLFRQMSDLLTAPVRKLLPPAGMIDFSAMIVMFAIIFIKTVFGV